MRRAASAGGRRSARAAMRRLRTSLALAVSGLAAGLAPAAAAERTRLVAYTALEIEQLDPIRRAIEAALPEVEIAWLRDSTGIVTDRMLAERDAPQADLLIGVAATSLLQFEAAHLLDPYRPAGVEALRPFFRDPTPPYSWTGWTPIWG